MLNLNKSELKTLIWTLDGLLDQLIEVLREEDKLPAEPNTHVLNVISIIEKAQEALVD
jgi:hypothetical protein